MTWAPILSLEDWIDNITGGCHTNCEAIVEGSDKSDYDKKTPGCLQKFYDRFARLTTRIIACDHNNFLGILD